MSPRFLPARTTEVFLPFVRMIYLDVTDSCKSPMNTGIQRVVRGLFRALCEAKLPVTPMLWEPKIRSFCALSRRERGFLEAPFAGPHGRKAHAQPARTAHPIPVWSKIASLLAHRRNRLDLASHLKSYDLILVPQIFRDSRGQFVIALGQKTGSRRIAFFYDAIPWRRPDVTPHRNVAGVLEYMMALADFDAVITSSREAMNDLQSCWQSNKARKMSSIHVLGWPVDESFTSAPISEPRIGIRQKILCVGTLEPRKNHLTLLAAVEKLWHEHRLDFELELIGRTTRECGPRVLAKVESLHKAGWPVHWRRHVDNDALLASYDECAFTVFPSLTEGFGLPIIESLQRGRPCVCGSNGALGEVSAGGGCLTVDQTDVTALADGMRQLLTDEPLYHRLCAESRARKFETWPEFVTKLRRLLNF